MGCTNMPAAALPLLLASGVSGAVHINDGMALITVQSQCPVQHLWK